MWVKLFWNHCVIIILRNTNISIKILREERLWCMHWIRQQSITQINIGKTFSSLWLFHYRTAHGFSILALICKKQVDVSLYPRSRCGRKKFKMCCEILKMRQEHGAELGGSRHSEGEGLRGSRKHIDMQIFVQRDPSVQRLRLHTLPVNYNIYSSNIFCTRHFHFTPVLFKCMKMTLSSQCMSGWLSFHVARGIATLLPSGVKKSSTKVFTHHHFNYRLSGTRSAETRTFSQHKDSKSYILALCYRGRAPLHPCFLFSDVYSLYMRADVYMSQGSQLKASLWLGCTW